MAKSIRSARQQRLIEVLIAARKDAGLTQAEVAKRLRHPQSFVAKVENGERRLDVVEFIALVEAIGNEPIELFAKVASASTSQ